MTVERAGKTEYEIRFYDINYKTNPRLPKPNGQFLFKTFSSYTNRESLALPPSWNQMTKIKQWQQNITKMRKTKMEWINIISNRDARVSKININNSYVTLEIEYWNGELRKINFKNYHIVKEKNSIGEEIGDIKIEKHSSLIEELKQDILNGGGTLKEINDIKHFIFYDSWNCRVIFEILAEITEYI